LLRAEPTGTLKIRPAIALLGLACVAATALRLAYALRSGLWRDEALALFISRVPTVDMILETLRLRESHPPLFYLMLHGWEGLFGVSDAAALALPLLLGVLLVPALFLVGRKVFSPRAALLAAVFAAVTPLLAEHSALVRPYSLLPLLGLLTTYALWRALLGAGMLAWSAYVILAILLVYAHNSGWIVVGALGLLGGRWLLCANTAPRSGWLAWTVAEAAIVMAYIPWAPSFVYQAHHAGYPAGPVRDLWSPLAMLSQTFTSLPQAQLAVAVVAVGLAAIATAYHRAKAADAGLQAPGYPLGFELFVGVPLITCAVAVVGSEFSNLLIARTLLTVVPLALLVASEGLAVVTEKCPRGTFAGIGAVFVGVYLTLAAGALSVPKSNARELAGLVTLKTTTTDLVVIAPEWLASSFNHYFTPGNQQIDYPNEGREGATPFSDLAARMADPQSLQRTKEALRHARAQGRRVWLVADHNTLVAPAPIDDGLPSDLAIAHWDIVGSIRTRQVLKELVRLYGRAQVFNTTLDARNSEENLSAYLFSPTPGGRP
jgi:hypothetical protein